ncbi:MAG: hypothetical protein HQK77_10905 [Desulfobacterales bacterium]|nr:hypothetical protein [Desulfobacterales bacterium]
MSNTLWVVRKSKKNDGNDFDHSVFYKLSDQLDTLAQFLKVKKLSDFLDVTDMQFNMSDEDLSESWISENQKWFKPSLALPSLKVILDRLKSDEVKGIKEKYRIPLIEELEDCFKKLEQADKEDDFFHFCIVM